MPSLAKWTLENLPNLIHISFTEVHLYNDPTQPNSTNKMQPNATWYYLTKPTQPNKLQPYTTQHNTIR